MNEINITTAKYGKDNSCINASIDSINITVPLDPANRHYQAIQEWVAEGNTIEPADPVEE
jgi:hypothetical protein